MLYKIFRLFASEIEYEHFDQNIPDTVVIHTNEHNITEEISDDTEENSDDTEEDYELV